MIGKDASRRVDFGAVARAPLAAMLGLVLAVLLAQLVVLVLGWVRVARLFALAEVARSLPSLRRRSGLPPVL